MGNAAWGRIAITAGLTAGAVFVALTAPLGSQEPEAPVRLDDRERAIALTLSPLPPLPKQPSNRFADDPEAARLGQRLFYDARLSRDGDRSCASCHSPGLGWSDGLPLSQGIAELNRNSPSLLHAGYQRWLFWDGRADSLWSQVQWPLEHPDEMGFARADLVRLIAGDEALRSEYEAIFGPLPDGAANPERFRPGGRPALPAPLDPFRPAPSLERMGDEGVGTKVPQTLVEFPGHGFVLGVQVEPVALAGDGLGQPTGEGEAGLEGGVRQDVEVDLGHAL